MITTKPPFGVNFAAVEIGLHREEIEKTALAAGEVGHQIKLGGLESGGHQLAEARRSEKLAVLNLLFRLTIAVVVVVVFAVQSMQAAVAGVGVVNILTGDASLHRCSAVDQVEHLFIEHFAALRVGRSWTIVIFHFLTPPQQAAPRYLLTNCSAYSGEWNFKSTLLFLNSFICFTFSQVGNSTKGSLMLR